MNDNVDDAGGGGTDPEPPDAQTQLGDALETLLGHDDQWRVTPSPGCLAVTRGWPDGSADSLIILSPETAYGLREDARGRQVWSVRGTVPDHRRRARPPNPVRAGCAVRTGR